MSPPRPIVLCFSGHDPSGGAGVQADIEALIAHRCHAASVITCLTEQNSHNVKKLHPQSADNLLSQARTILADLDVSVFKIGLIGSPELALAIAQILSEHPRIPVVLDPVLAAGGGTNFSNQDLIEVITEYLLPYTKILTPNNQEARRLTGLENLQACGNRLLELGCQYVLITGGDEVSTDVCNQLFFENSYQQSYHWQRLPASYHGSGCTLASSIAALLAHGINPVQAIADAQNYTWQALQTGYRPSQGQYNPNRFFAWNKVS